MKEVTKNSRTGLLHWLETQCKCLAAFFLNRYSKIENGFNIINR